MKNNFGYIQPIRKPTDRIFGASKTPMDNFPTNNWFSWLPKIEIQKNNSIDTYNCTGYGTANAIEAYLKRKYNENNDFSERAIGILAGTRPPGNDPVTVAQAWRDNGIIKESTLPFNEMIRSIEQYYSPSPLTASQIVEAQEWDAKYDLQYDYVFTDENTLEEKRKKLKEALYHSPVCVSVYAWEQYVNGLYFKPEGMTDNHWTLLYAIEPDGTYNIFDSYDNTHKRLRPDYDFGFALRYYVEKKIQQPVPVKSCFLRFLCNWFPEPNYI